MSTLAISVRFRMSKKTDLKIRQKQFIPKGTKVGLNELHISIVGLLLHIQKLERITLMNIANRRQRIFKSKI